MQAHGKPRYSILLDIFKPEDLIENRKTSSKASQYLNALQGKNLIKYPDDLELDPWCSRVHKEGDIFAPLKRRRRSTVVKSSENAFNQLSLDSEAKPTTNYLDYRFSRVETVAVDMKKGELLSANEPLRGKLLGYGVVRLYKDHEDLALPEKTIEGDEKRTVAILGVPFYFTASDLLLGFFDPSLSDDVSHMRMLRTETPNRTMVLMKFRSDEKAANFLEEYNGRHFNSMEPEACRVVYVKEVLIRTGMEHDHDTLSTIPYLLDDPFTESTTQVRDSPYVELATCPVCLERLDSTVTGLLTIPCQHTFHYGCLSQWDDDTCPVCRYSSKFDMRKRHEETEEEKCEECGAADNLWICLICGHVGCGRYDGAHAIDHYNDTQHCFAMETTTQRVWDYAGDNYVHRLVQNEADGKLVELPSKELDTSDGGSAKVEKMGLEYSKMLISQLESQREYYDSKFEEVQNQLMLANENAKEYRQQVASLKSQVAKLKGDESELGTAKKKYEEESSMNEGLSEKVAYLTAQVKELQRSKNDLEEQNKDLMFFLEAQEKFKDAGENVREGQVIIKQGRTKKIKKKGRK